MTAKKINDFILKLFIIFFILIFINLVFIQVMINLLRMAMDTIVNRGFIKMHTDAMRSRNGVLKLVVNFALSSCKLDDRER